VSGCVSVVSSGILLLSWKNIAVIPLIDLSENPEPALYAKALRFKKYVQSHFQPSPEIEAFAAMRGWTSPAEGLAELWWESMDEMRAAFTTPEGQAASVDLARDEAEFIDPTRISAFLSHEHVIFDYT
jgi:EthD domain